MEPMMQAQRAQNPLFLRDAELERSLALLTLLQLELEAAIGQTLDRQQLEPADAQVLAQVDHAAARGEPATAAELATFLGWTKQRMSRRLAALVAQGLIERRPSPTDRRKQEVLPTSHGSHQVAAFKSLQKRHLRRIFRRAGATDVAGFQNVLAVAAQHAGRARQAALPAGTFGAALPGLGSADGAATRAASGADARAAAGDALVGGER
jgi:MarR family transcriptional regulator, organic hydroperoxide resistance regulator